MRRIPTQSFTLARRFFFGSSKARPAPAWKLGAVSPSLVVPQEIPRPSYVAGTPAAQVKGIVAKTPDEIEKMRRVCRLTSKIRAFAISLCQVGATTDDIDRQVHEEIIRLGAYPSPLGYSGFPKSLCTSVNQVVCHGIPDNRPLEDGDIINCDVVTYLDGFHGDCSAMALVGDVDAKGKELVQVTKECLDLATEAVRPGLPLTEIGLIIEEHASKHGLGIVQDYCGHGLGREIHQPPHILHYINNMKGELIEGMTFTIEPMLTEGSSQVFTMEDGWTVLTADETRSAQWENTLLVTANGVEVLTTHQD